MSETLLSHIADLWQGIRAKTASAVAERETHYVLGKTPARTILDEHGEILVDAGQRIDERILERVTRAGAMHDLTAAVAEAQAQDTKEHVLRLYDNTQDGQQAKHESSQDLYMEARHYIGCCAGLDVTDIKGNVLVYQGRRISYEDVVSAREAGQLSALIHSARQPPPPDSEPCEETGKLGTVEHQPAENTARRPATLLNPDAEDYRTEV